VRSGCALFLKSAHGAWRLGWIYPRLPAVIFCFCFVIDRVRHIQTWRYTNRPVPVRRFDPDLDQSAADSSQNRPAPRPGPTQKQQETTKERAETRPQTYFFRRGHVGRRGEIYGCSSPLAPSSSTSTLQSSPLSLRSLHSHSDALLFASSSAGAGTQLLLRTWRRRSPRSTGCIAGCGRSAAGAGTSPCVSPPPSASPPTWSSAGSFSEGSS